MSVTIELRILAGLHAGAVVGLPGDGSPVTLGADEANAVILRDAVFATATLAADEATWVLDLGERQIALASGDAVHLGALALALVERGSPWNDDALRWVEAVETAIPEADTVTAPLMREDDAIASAPVPGAATPDGATGMPTSAPSRPSRSRGAYALAGVAALAAILAPGIVVFGGNDSPAPAAAPAAAREPVRVDPKAVEAAVQQAGYGELVRVVPRDDGRVSLRGVVADEEAQEALLKAVSLVTRRVALELLTQREFSQRVNAITALLPEGVKARPAEGGIVALRGEVGDADDIALSVTTVKTEIPEANGVEASALSVVKLSPAAATPRPPAPPRLPSLIAVQGGVNSYVMLASGERVLPGASINGYRLAAIEDDAIVVEDRGGRRYRIPR